MAVPSRERSHAIGATGMLYLPEMLPDLVPTRLFLRGGFAYKDISHVAAVGTFHEGVISWVAGFGLQFELTSRIFMRLEYEFVSRGIGGTNRVINVMHTPLSASLGVRF
jgi:hypothetical protein